MELYHYRSADTAVKEIVNGTFYFADREELNDPLEGDAQIFWQGDIPAWEGLFGNYICSLYHSLVNYLLKAKYEEIQKNAVLVDTNCSGRDVLRKVYQDLKLRFVSGPYVGKLIRYLGNRNVRVSSKNLKFVLRLVHESAFSTCMKSMKENKLIPQEQKECYVPEEKLSSMFSEDIMKEIDDQRIKIAIETVAGMMEDTIESRFLAEKWDENGEMTQRQIWYKVRMNFPDIYAEQLQEVIYPKGYVVCFSADCHNSSMWGNYADNHRGVCLIYETKQENEKEIMRLKSQVSLTSAGSTFSWKNQEVVPVVYDADVICRNGFESFGRLNYSQARSWLTAANGCESSLMSVYRESNKKWIHKYWTDYTEKYSRKLAEWKAEKEYRMFLFENFHRYTGDERLISYDPDSFKGVIFGIKTSEPEKQRIISAVKESGKNLQDFSFCQTVYDDEKQKIEIRKKHLFLK